jgi:hypothetical protein
VASATLSLMEASRLSRKVDRTFTELEDVLLAGMPRTDQRQACLEALHRERQKILAEIERRREKP